MIKGVSFVKELPGMRILKIKSIILYIYYRDKIIIGVCYEKENRNDDVGMCFCAGHGRLHGYSKSE